MLCFESSGIFFLVCPSIVSVLFTFIRPLPLSLFIKETLSGKMQATTSHRCRDHVGQRRAMLINIPFPCPFGNQAASILYTMSSTIIVFRLPRMHNSYCSVLCSVCPGSLTFH